VNAPVERRSALQFELRRVFVLVTCAALACVVAAPWIRSWPFERQAYFLRLILVAGFSALSFAAPVFYFRYRAERTCGGCIIELVPHSPRRQTILKWILVAIMLAACLPLFLVDPTAAFSSRGGFASTGYFLAFSVGVQIGSLLPHAWWGRRGTELCEQGVIIEGARHCTWSTLRYVRWHPDTGKLGLGTGLSPVYLTVPLALRDRVSELLRAKQLG
jgi:hypothetical protein